MQYIKMWAKYISASLNVKGKRKLFIKRRTSFDSGYKKNPCLRYESINLALSVMEVPSDAPLQLAVQLHLILAAYLRVELFGMRQELFYDSRIEVVPP